MAQTSQELAAPLTRAIMEDVTRLLGLLGILALLACAACGNLDAYAFGTQHDYDGTGPNSWAAGWWSWKTVPDGWEDAGPASELGVLVED